ncbi:MAG: sulfatase-like hydrolase/transferase [Rhizobiales bacterium]|nr:sulfatase-like hydrolase/transferase [Hyphomicrobiales bacterium]
MSLKQTPEEPIFVFLNGSLKMPLWAKVDTPVNKFLRTPLVFKLVFIFNLCLAQNVIYQFFFVEQSYTYALVLLAATGIASLIFGLATAVVIILNLLIVFYAFSWTKLSFVGMPVYYQDLQLIGWNFVEVIFYDWRAQLAIAAALLVIFLQYKVFQPIAIQARRKWLKGSILIGAAVLLVPAASAEIERKQRWTPGLTTDSHRVLPTVTAFALSLVGVGEVGLAVSPRFTEFTGASPGAQNNAHDAGDRKINLIFIQYESTFPVDKLLPKYARSQSSQILAPEHGFNGSLYTPIYGGGSWLSEFSLVTGQTPFAFGAHAFTLQYLLEGKLKSSLAIRASRAGFTSSVIYPVGGHFINAGNFYESLGFNFHTALESEWGWVIDDRILFDKTAKAIKGNDRNLVFIVTMANHGPHSVTDPFEDYYQRLKVQDAKLSSFKTHLVEEYSDFENYIVSYGDHQPAFTQFLFDKKLDLHKTFWSIDCVGQCDRFSAMTFPAESMGLEFLPSFVSEQVGIIPADGVVTAHQFVWRKGCRSLQFDCSTKARNTVNWAQSQFIDIPDVQLTEARSDKP